MKNKIVTINYDLRKVSAKEINNIIPHLKESVNEELPESDCKPYSYIFEHCIYRGYKEMKRINLTSEDVKETLLELGEQEMNSYADTPEVKKSQSVIEVLLGEVEEQVKHIESKTENLYSVFAPVLKDKSSSSGIDESPQEDFGTYSSVGKRLKSIREDLKGISNRLDSISYDSETH
jgi:septation ring formation regulator EzrA